jgi:hypothetical protein
MILYSSAYQAIDSSATFSRVRVAKRLRVKRRIASLSLMLLQRSDKTFRDGARIRQLTFPNGEDSPAELAQLSPFFLITAHRTIDLVSPKFRSRARIVSVPATCMVMPEAPVDEDGSSETRKHYIRFARKTVHVHTKPEAQSMQQGAHDHFWLRVASAYAAHYPTAFFS